MSFQKGFIKRAQQFGATEQSATWLFKEAFFGPGTNVQFGGSLGGGQSIGGSIKKFQQQSPVGTAPISPGGQGGGPLGDYFRKMMGGDSLGGAARKIQQNPMGPMRPMNGAPSPLTPQQPQQAPTGQPGATMGQAAPQPMGQQPGFDIRRAMQM